MCCMKCGKGFSNDDSGKILDYIELLCDMLTAHNNFYTHGCACWEHCQACDEENTQCTGEFMQQVFELSQDVIPAVLVYVQKQRKEKEAA